MVATHLTNRFPHGGGSETLRNDGRAGPVELGMKVEIWSDVVCPWCYIGKRRITSALARFEHRDEVEVVWHSFELDPQAPRRREGDPAARLAAKYGMSREEAVAAQANLTKVAAGDGLAFRLDLSKSGNTFDAHRLLHLAADRGILDAVKERLFAAYLVEGEAIGELETLVRVVSEAGLDADEARAVLDGTAYADEVRADELEASDIGITGVPFFVIDRKYAVSGAQPADVLVDVLRRAWSEAHPLVRVDGGSGADGICEGDSCAV
jgi:predicted DsbA family dithiol-disulfide isomerase